MPGSRLAPTSLPTSARRSGTRRRAALPTKHSMVPGQVPPGWLVPVLVIPGSLCAAGRGEQQHMQQGCRQGMGRDRQRVWQGAGSARTETQAAQHPLPLLAAALLGMLWCSPVRWNIQCWHRTGSESSGLTLHRSSQPLTEKTWPGGAGGQGTQSPGTRS